jgi:hypothetical protein
MPATMMTGTPIGQAASFNPCPTARMPRKRGCSRGKLYLTAKKWDWTISASPINTPGKIPPSSSAPVDTPAVAP